MKNLKYYQDIIKEKRKSTDFRDFNLEISSWLPVSFYKNSGNISRYPETKKSPKVISNKEFIKNRDDILKYGFEYNFQNTFFANFQKLFLSVPISANISQMTGENTDFADTVVSSQNVYLSSIVVENCENIFYSFQILVNSNNIFNCSVVYENCENIYFSKGIIKSFKIFYSKYLDNCSNIWFSSNLIGCTECIFCNDLDNKKYCIKNIEYSKYEYLKKKEVILKNKNKFFEYYLEIDNIGKNTNCVNVNGKFIKNSENIENGFSVIDNTKNSRNIIFTGHGENFYDCVDVGLDSKDFYGVEGGGTYSNNIYCSSQIETCSNIYYSFYCNNSNFCIGCIGLKNKSYCILNKQYTKEEWEILADKIFGEMEKEGTLGDFFPGELNPFYFNDTMAGLLGNFTKEEVEKEGYMWRDEEIKVDIPENAEIIETKDLEKFQGYSQDGEWRINPDILKKVIKDEKGNYYKIVKMEYDFLVKHGLPLPSIHWLDRMKLNLGV